MLSLLLGLVLTQSPEPVNRYRLNDFYSYDQNGCVEALPLQPKIFFILNDNFWSLSEETKTVFFRTLIQFGKSDEVKDFSLKKVADNLMVAEFDPEQVSARELIEFLNGFPDYQKLLRYPVGNALPIVVWREREVVAISTIVLETKPAIASPEQLKEILKSFGKFNFEVTRPIDFPLNRFEVIVSEINPPLNIFVLANLIAEDKIHFQWAMPRFSPLWEPIVARMYVTSGGIDSLGGKKYLHLEISITNSKITLLKNLIPQLGEGEFVVNVPQYNDVWFWADKPIINEREEGILRTIEFVWPFVYLEVGSFTFKDIAIAYEEDNGDGPKTENSLTVNGCPFQNSSVIEGVQPPIKDIQPVHDYSVGDWRKIEKPPIDEKGALGAIKNWVWLPGAGIGLFLFLNNALLLFKEKKRQRQKIIDAEKERLKEWDELKLTLKDLSLENWENHYPVIEAQLKRILKKFFGLSPSIDSETVEDPLLKWVFRELEKVYREDDAVNPDFKIDLTILKANINTFINQSKGGDL